jgi:hypothetical protein
MKLGNCIKGTRDLPGFIATSQIMLVVPVVETLLIDLYILSKNYKQHTYWKNRSPENKLAIYQKLLYRGLGIEKTGTTRMH